MSAEQDHKKSRRKPNLRINRILLDQANAASSAAEAVRDGKPVTISDVLVRSNGIPRYLTEADLPLVEALADVRIRLLALDIRASARHVKTGDIVSKIQNNS